jgi:hypothetical protein
LISGKEAVMELLKQVAVIETSSTKKFLIGDEFVVGKNGIRWVDPSFKERIVDGTVIKAQKGTRLACDILQKSATSRHIIDAVGGIEKATISGADLLAVIRSGKLEKDVRYVCIVRGHAIRIDWVRDGWCIHAFSVEVPGEWSIGRQFIFRNGPRG